jgi:SHS2 domain-containing protein
VSEKGGSHKRRGAKYRPWSHTADLGWRIFGNTLEELFENAAGALMATLTDRRTIRPREIREVALAAPDREALLVDWLNHLLYLFDLDGFLGRDFKVLTLTAELLKAQARGEIFDPGRHPEKTGVKAATYHHLAITPKNHGWQATVILDL